VPLPTAPRELECPDGEIMKTLRMLLSLSVIVPCFTLVGYDSWAGYWYGAVTGGLIGLFFGLAFGGAKGKWLDNILGPEDPRPPEDTTT
jgi:hypothetical protein